jgi:hypothetical protein
MFVIKISASAVSGAGGTFLAKYGNQAKINASWFIKKLMEVS